MDVCSTLLELNTCVVAPRTSLRSRQNMDRNGQMLELHRWPFCGWT